MLKKKKLRGTSLKAGSEVDVWREVTSIYFEHGPNGSLNRPASVEAIAHRYLKTQRSLEKRIKTQRFAFWDLLKTPSIAQPPWRP